MVTYDEMAKKYGVSGSNFPESRAMSWWIDAYFQAAFEHCVCWTYPTGDSLFVDFGCGCGTWLNFLASFGMPKGCLRRVVGYDTSEEAIKVAQRMAFQVATTTTTVLSKVPVGDVVFCNRVLRPMNSGMNPLEALRQVLSKGRRFIIMDLFPKNVQPWMNVSFDKPPRITLSHGGMLSALHEVGATVESDQLISVFDTKLFHYSRKIGRWLDWPAVMLTYGLDVLLRNIFQEGRIRMIQGVSNVSSE